MLIGGGAFARPLATRGQQPDRARQIGVLMTYAESDPDGQARLTAFLTAFSEFGWIDDRNSRIAIRWSAGELERMHRFAKELVALARDGSHAQAAKGFSPRCSRFEGRLAQINSALAFYNQPLDHHAPLLVKSTEITPPTSGGGH
jgi:hypothetical protein